MLRTVLALVLLLVPAAACAQAQEDEARRLYARGTELARDEARCGDAIEFFRRAIAIRETPQRVLSLAACLAATGRHVDAIDAFTTYLSMDDISAEDRRAVRAALAEERRAVGTLDLHVEPADAEVYIDGVRRDITGSERHLLLDTGRRSLEVRAEGYISRRITVSSLPGQEGRLSIALQRDDREAPRLIVEADRSEAEISIDGTVVGVGRYEGTVTEGRHRVRVRAPSHADFHAEVDARYAETVRLHARLGASEGGDDIAASPVFWTILVLAVAAAAVGIGVGVWAAEPQIDAGNTGLILVGLGPRF